MERKRINVRGVIFQDNKLYCQKITPVPEDPNTHYWCTPGGGLEADEPILQGLEREIVEETGVKPKIGKLLFVNQFNNKNHERGEQVELFFLIENPSDYLAVNLATTSHGQIECEKSDFINPSTNCVLPDFLQTIDIQSYITNNLPVFIKNSL